MPAGSVHVKRVIELIMNRKRKEITNESMGKQEEIQDKILKA